MLVCFKHNSSGDGIQSALTTQTPAESNSIPSLTATLIVRLWEKMGLFLHPLPFSPPPPTCRPAEALCTSAKTQTTEPCRERLFHPDNPTLGSYCQMILRWAGSFFLSIFYLPLGVVYWAQIVRRGLPAKSPPLNPLPPPTLTRVHTHTHFTTSALGPVGFRKTS